MGRVWVLDTATKGTGAEMVPLESVLKKPARTHEPLYVPPKPRPRPLAEPEPKQPRRFRVVDVTTQQVLLDDAGGPATLDLLKGVRSTVDVHIFVWEPKPKKWRLLTLAEQQALWERRGLAGASPHTVRG
jgi:hypothetical protein